MHKPVLTEEIIHYLNLYNGKIIVDATLGCGGHAALILDRILPNGFLIGIDQDHEILSLAKKKLSRFDKSSYEIINENFKNIDLILKQLHIEKIDGIVFDLGISLWQLEQGHRGFSITKDGPLDMRMDLKKEINAYKIVNRYSLDRLKYIIKTFGEERYARSIAKAITRERKKEKISTTSQLAGIIKKEIGFKYRRLRIHPATRTFQALRIEVNHELEAISEALEKLPFILKEKARVCIIAFHSLEDRIIKNYFKKYQRENKFLLINKKPMVPSRQEIKENPRSRSAKLRVAEFKC